MNWQQDPLSRGIGGGLSGGIIGAGLEECLVIMFDAAGERYPLVGFISGSLLGLYLSVTNNFDLQGTTKVIAGYFIIGILVGALGGFVFGKVMRYLSNEDVFAGKIEVYWRRKGVVFGCILCSVISVSIGLIVCRDKSLKEIRPRDGTND